jgi:hypothetical protein
MLCLKISRQWAVSKIIFMFIVIHNRQEQSDFDNVKSTVMFYYACNFSKQCFKLYFVFQVSVW